MVESIESAAPVRVPLPLDKYSLADHYDDLVKLKVAPVPVLGDFALMGELTVIYAAPNTGKTLITLAALREAIYRKPTDKHPGIDGSKVYYINLDDSVHGLIDKLEISNGCKFHMLAEGHQNFSVGKFMLEIERMIDGGTARGCVVILDTLKKFCDPMSKTESAQFATKMRAFSMNGGTVIALGHTNKHKDAAGRSSYSGTSDIVSDFDSAYVVDDCSASDDSAEKLVEFKRIKSRSPVPERIMYSYARQADTYLDLLISVKKVDEANVAALRRQADLVKDAEAIETVKECILEGVCQKMLLVKEVSRRTGLSQHIVASILEKYTGADTESCRWIMQVGAKGAKLFSLHPGELAEIESQDF